VHLDLGTLLILNLANDRTGILLATTIIYSYIEIATKEGTPGLSAMGDLLG
jgi:hypothetical protein